MALVMCEECKKEISDQANSCPQCGCPVKCQKSENISNIKPIDVTASRWSLILSGNMTEFIFPKKIIFDGQYLQTHNKRFFLFPWLESHEKMPSHQIASIQHSKGLIWDKVIVETSGGSNNLDIKGLKKFDAKRLITAIEYVIYHKDGKM